MRPVNVDVDLEDEFSEKRFWQSKKWWIWFVSFGGLFALTLESMRLGGESRVQIALIIALSFVSCAGLFGFAWVDAAVRFARIIRGDSTLAELGRALVPPKPRNASAPPPPNDGDTDKTTP